MHTHALKYTGAEGSDFTSKWRDLRCHQKGIGIAASKIDANAKN